MAKAKSPANGKTGIQKPRFKGPTEFVRLDSTGIAAVMENRSMRSDVGSHWENIYKTKAPDNVSWFRPHLERSLSLIERAVPEHTATIIDVGGGESTLVDDLLARGYSNLTVLDISQKALAVTKERLGQSADSVQWVCADVIAAPLPAHFYDVWHDRAVFHFLTTDEQRKAYVHTVEKVVRPGGHVIVSTFGPEGPTKCSGLPVRKYDADELHAEFGNHFRLIESSKELHQTPFGTTQQFLYCYCGLISS
jgi:2-polyprenyl-3-methyl-5-hydroxy-6-metoxy-1,4-benzoquinol methylase